MTLKTRVAKLEAAMLTKHDPVRIGYFIYAPGDTTGYTCNGVDIIRELGESLESLQNRCFDAVSWPDETCTYIFHYCMREPNHEHKTACYQTRTAERQQGTRYDLASCWRN